MERLFEKACARREFIKEVASVAAHGALAYYLHLEFPLRPSINRQVLARIPLALDSRVINGLETHGENVPINRSRLQDFFCYINSQNARMAANTYYGEFFMSLDDYWRFALDNGESPQSFLKRHERKFQEIICVGENNVGALIRRLTIFSNSDGVLQESDLRGHATDIDGAWVSSPSYQPKLSAYYNSRLNIDAGLLHEFGHQYASLPDHESLDFTHKDTSPSLFADIPTVWRAYDVLTRGDIKPDLMTLPYNVSINQYTYLQLLRRLKEGDIHDKKWIQENRWSFPNEVPETICLYTGGGLAGRNIMVYRTLEQFPRLEEYKRRKGMELIGIKTTVSDRFIVFDKSELFPREGRLVPAEQAVFFLRTDDEGEDIRFRWLDIRDFSIPYWLGYKNEVVMFLNWAGKTDKPETFDWTINYRDFLF